MIKSNSKRFKDVRKSEKACFLLCSITSLVAIIILVWIYKNEIHAKVNPNTETTPQTIETEEYRNEIEAKTIQTPEPTVVYETIPETEPKPTFPATYTAVEGDTWETISVKYFDDDKYAEGISYTNGERYSNDPVYEGESIIVENSDKLEEALVDSFNSKYDVFYAGPEGGYTDGHPNPAIDINVPKGNSGKNFEGEVDTSEFVYQGDFTITGYAPFCSHCCGGEGITASGAIAVDGYTVACGIYPFGTTLYIEGYGFYVVEDTGSGVDGYHLDIAAPDHESCYALTNSGVSVYLVPNNNDKV